MPLIRLKISESISTDLSKSLITGLSARAAEIMGKNEDFMMVILEPNCTMLMGGNEGPTALIEVRSLGEFTPELTGPLSEGLTTLITQQLDISGERIYAIFETVARERWAKNGKTFG
ncbi:hypothetical protein KAI87_17445 [Myxococcota bacterium]|nr:hypothetical protein [Myxococcota bacterium]